MSQNAALSPDALTRHGSAERPEIDVVVLTWNDGDLLKKAIGSAMKSREVSVNVIVVDNGSQPPAIVPTGVTLLRNDQNVGVAAGRNQGVRAGSAPLVLLLDSDAELLPDSLATLVDEQLRTDAGVIVPVFDDQEPEASAGDAPGLARKALRVMGKTAHYARRHDSSEPSWPVEFGIGACQLFPRSVWEAIGGIDESFFYGPEDVDFCLRVLDHGREVRQAAGAPVIHPPRRRHRKPLNRAGIKHAWAVVRYLTRHRRRLITLGSRRR